MSTCAELAVMLAEAQAAVHKVALGGSVTMRRSGEKAVSYSPADLGLLKSYIRELQRQVDACNGTTRTPGAGLTHFMPIDD